MSVEEKKWYAVYTRPRWEKKVFDLLSAQGFETYCPMNRVRKRWSDRIKWVEEPLFRSYLFVRIEESRQTAVRMTEGVVNFVYWLGKPAIVRASEIAVVRRFLNDYVEVKAEAIPMVPESKWRVERGALMDKQVKVLRVQGNKVRVIIESIGYSLIALVDRSNLTVAGKE